MSPFTEEQIKYLQEVFHLRMDSHVTNEEMTNSSSSSSFSSIKRSMPFGKGKGRAKIAKNGSNSSGSGSGSGNDDEGRDFFNSVEEIENPSVSLKMTVNDFKKLEDHERDLYCKHLIAFLDFNRCFESIGKFHTFLCGDRQQMNNIFIKSIEIKPLWLKIIAALDGYHNAFESRHASTVPGYITSSETIFDTLKDMSMNLDEITFPNVKNFTPRVYKPKKKTSSEPEPEPEHANDTAAEPANDVEFEDHECTQAQTQVDDDSDAESEGEGEGEGDAESEGEAESDAEGEGEEGEGEGESDAEKTQVEEPQHTTSKRLETLENLTELNNDPDVESRKRKADDESLEQQPMEKFQRVNCYWEHYDLTCIAKVRMQNGNEQTYRQWYTKAVSDNANGLNEDRYVAFQMTNGEWMDLEAFYIMILKKYRPEPNLETMKLVTLQTKYKFLRPRLVRGTAVAVGSGSGSGSSF